jgi:hypothetical protein
MQDKYTGDIGDFGKYILLNELSKLSGGSIKLGVNWFYVNKPEKNSGDGRHIEYLNSQYPKNKFFRDCNPQLYDKLQNIVKNNKRSISEIEKGHILPINTNFYSVPLPYSSGTRIHRCKDREEWFINSFSIFKTTDIIFLDPDNGLQTLNLQKSQAKAVKYTFIDEILKYYDAGKSVVIYQHRDRSPKEKYNAMFKLLSAAVGCDIQVLRFKRVSVRDYIFIPQPKHTNLFSKLISRDL